MPGRPKVAEHLAVTRSRVGRVLSWSYAERFAAARASVGPLRLVVIEPTAEAGAAVAAYLRAYLGERVSEVLVELARSPGDAAEHPPAMAWVGASVPGAAAVRHALEGHGTVVVPGRGEGPDEATLRALGWAEGVVRGRRALAAARAVEAELEACLAPMPADVGDPRLGLEAIRDLARKEAVARCGGDRAQAAQQLEIDRKTLGRGDDEVVA
jgi:hypothetical protein